MTEDIEVPAKRSQQEDQLKRLLTSLNRVNEEYRTAVRMTIELFQVLSLHTSPIKAKTIRDVRKGLALEVAKTMTKEKRLNSKYQSFTIEQAGELVKQNSKLKLFLTDLIDYLGELSESTEYFSPYMFNVLMKTTAVRYTEILDPEQSPFN